MTSNKKAITGSIVIIALVIVLLVLLWQVLSGKITFSRRNSNYENRYVTILKKNYPTDILIIGEKFELFDGLYCRYSDVITEDILKTLDGCNRQNIIISCYNGQFNPTVEELKLIADKINEHKCDVYFVGNSLDEKMVEAGIISFPQKENHWMGYVYYAWETTLYGNGIDGTNLDFNNEEDQAECVTGLLELFLHNLNESLR